MNIYVLNVKKLRGKARVIITCVAAFLLCTVLFLSLRELYNGDSISASNTAELSRVVIIDAGHGGEDSGAVGVTGALEKDLNLEISLVLGEMLINEGFIVIYTRTTDRMLYSKDENIKGMRKLSDLKNRCALANEYPEALFISVHMNSFGSSKYSGLQVYYANGNSDSQGLATSIQTEVRKNLQPENKRQIKNGKDLYILDNSKATTVLIECGFLTNQTECQKLSQKEYQKQLSFAIVCGIIDYVEKTEAANQP